MFQAVPPSIVRSTNLYIQRQSIVKPILLSAAIVDEIKRSAPNDGRRNRLKHVEQFIEINISRKRCILLVVLQRLHRVIGANA